MSEQKSVAALVFGIFSLFFWIIPLFGFPVSVAGLIFSVKGKGNRYAKAALICSIIGLVLTTLNASWGAYLGITGQHALASQLLE